MASLNILIFWHKNPKKIFDGKKGILTYYTENYIANFKYFKLKMKNPKKAINRKFLELKFFWKNFFELYKNKFSVKLINNISNEPTVGIVQ